MSPRNLEKDREYDRKRYKENYKRRAACKAYADYNRDAVEKLRTDRRNVLLEKAGGSCHKCGYNKYLGALHFHHLRDKKFTLSKRGMTKNWDAVLAEFEKCVLLCANCHAEEHNGERLEREQARLLSEGQG